jgi:hypothetical protein
MSYASVEANALHFVTHTLRPYIVKIEDAYSKILPEGVFLKFNVDGLLRGDSEARAQVYSSGLQAGWLSINDIHRLEDMTPVDGGDVYRVPLANVDLSAAPAIAHTGVPSTQLQPLATLDPTDPQAAYDVE